ncbi:MAG: hypothetical protein R3B09_00050 [Nannocystaceae bacterium]
MRRAASTLLPVALVLLAAGCDDLRTASHKFGLTVEDFPRVPGDPPFHVVDGTVLCTEQLHCSGCDDCEGDAVNLSIAGATADANGCYTAELGAPLTYNFSAGACASAPPSESFEVDAIAISEVRARLDTKITHVDELDDVFYGPPARSQGAAPPTRAQDDPIQLLAGSTVRVHVDVLEDATSRIVGWNGAAGSLALTAIDGAAPMATGSAQDPSLAAGSPGDRASATLTLAGVDLPLVDVAVVDRSVIDHLEITALFYDGGDDGQSPAQLEAHLVDAEGRLIHGAPVEWQLVDGNLEISIDEDDPKSPIVAVSETCAPRDLAATRSATVEASSDELKATLEIEWPGYHGDDNTLERCEGCGCRGGDPSGLAGLALGLAALGLRRRRASA